MAKETIKTKCGLEILNIFLRFAKGILSIRKRCKFDTKYIFLLEFKTPEQFLLIIVDSKSEMAELAIAIDGTQNEAIEEFEAVCARFKTEPTKWNLKI